jgi:hypothetical protein
MTQAVECLICKLKVLSSNTSSTQKGKERRGGLVGGEQEGSARQQTQQACAAE